MRGKHGAAPLSWVERRREWAKRPRQPFRLDHVRLLLLLLPLGPALLLGGVRAVLAGEARTGLLAAVLGLPVTVALAAYVCRPVRQDEAVGGQHWDSNRQRPQQPSGWRYRP